MKTFKNIKDLLSRDELKSIIAGSGSGSGQTCTAVCKDDNNKILAEKTVSSCDVSYGCPSGTTTAVCGCV